VEFTKAIVRRPCKAMTDGLTSANLGKPDYQLALTQHDHYIVALQNCGLDVTMLEADEHFPDSTFVEDVALLTPSCAIITNPGAPSRRGEIESIEQAVKLHFDNVEHIQPPDTVDAGDIMMVGSHFYIGLSERTTPEGAAQMIAILQKHGMTGSTVPLKHVLHLKSGVAYLEDNNLAATGEFIGREEFAQFNIIEIDDDESYAANCVWINGTVLVAAGFPRAKRAFEARGLKTLPLDMSEFQKLDGGLSCLSLRF